MIFGGHVSVAGGLTKALDRAHERGFKAIQIFVSSPRSFKITPYTDDEIHLFKLMKSGKGIELIFLHAVYLINLASPSEDLRSRSVDSLVHYLTLGSKIGARGTVVHVGAPANEASIRTSIRSIREVLAKTPQDQSVIVENAASFNRIGSFKDFVSIHRAINCVNDSCSIVEKKMSGRVKFCIDAQHLFASGVDVRDAGILSQWLGEFDREIGIEYLACVHANDSKTALGSQTDRHANIGDGAIGKDGFASILAQPRLKNIPFILETPGHDPKYKGPDRQNLLVLENLAKPMSSSHPEE